MTSEGGYAVLNQGAAMKVQITVDDENEPVKATHEVVKKDIGPAR